MFSSLIRSITNWCSHIVKPLRALFTRSTIDETALSELRILLIAADIDYRTTDHIILTVRDRMKNYPQGTGSDLRRELHRVIVETIDRPPVSTTTTPTARVILLVGVNGSGKTTTAAKLAYAAQQQGKRPLLVAADTFRAAATDQLVQWGNTLRIPVIQGGIGQDPASVVFKGCESFRTGLYDLMIIDTAGRLQTKSHLMSELTKVRTVLTKQIPQEVVETFLSIDSMLGQNSLQQARIFHESTPLAGIILTKMDGSGKGGVILAVSNQLGIPVRYITTGESIDALEYFNPHSFASAMLGMDHS